MSATGRERTLGPFHASLAAWLVGVAVVVLEFAWLRWFLFEPLPNVHNIGGEVKRWLLLSRAVPEVIPGVTYAQSYLGMAMGELSHVENLSQRVPIVLSAALIAGASLALGLLALRVLRLNRFLTVYERIPLAYGMGTAGLGVTAMVLGRLALLSALRPWGTRSGLGLLIVIELACLAAEVARWGSRGPRDGPRFARIGLAPSRSRFAAIAGLTVIVVPFLFLMFLAAMLPAIDFDALAYHLEGPKEYFQGGRIRFLPHNVYTSMPFNVEMLHLLGMEVIGDWWWGALVGQLLVMLYAPATAAMIALVALRWASRRAAWFAAVIYLTTPWIYRLGVLPYVEGPLCFFHAALIWAAGRAWDAGPAVHTRLWGVTGTLAGGAMACKYPALISAVGPFGALAVADFVRRRALPVAKRDVLLSPAIKAGRRGAWLVPMAFVAGWAIIIGPWLLKNVIDTGNPVYPLAYGVFGGRHWDSALDAKWRTAHGSALAGDREISLPALADSVLDVVGRSDWQSPLFTAFAPFALLRKGSRRIAAILIAYVFYLFATWWFLTHRLDRFWLPLVPVFAVLAGLGADWTRSWAWSALCALILALGIGTNLVYVSTALASLNQWTGDLHELRGEVPRLLNAPLARLDTVLPSDAVVLMVGQSGVFHMRHRIVYNTVFNPETIETLASGRSATEVRRSLAERGITHVYVDWAEVQRYRQPGNYGFTPFVTESLFERLVRAGVLVPQENTGQKQNLYRVVGDDPRSTPTPPQPSPRRGWEKKANDASEISR